MNTIALNARTARPATHRSALIDFVTHILELREGARDGVAIQTRYETYSRMSKPELNALGMTRSDIYRAALVGRPV